MFLKDKVLPYLKKAGIVVIGIVVTFILAKLHGLLKAKDEKKEEKVKDNIDNIDTQVKEISESLDNSNAALGDIKEIIKNNGEKKEELVSNSVNERIKIVKKAGFEKKKPFN
jgi:uncharacterized membrane-anchored protein YhcB (DUF1043 family)